MTGFLGIALLAAACSSPGPKRASADSGVLRSPAAAPPSGTDTAPVARSGVGVVWTEALANPQHSSSANVVGPTTGHVIWQRSLGAPVVAGAIAGQDGTIYESANDGTLHAIDPATGRDRWVFNGEGTTDNNQDLSTSPAVLADGTVLWPAPAGRLDALTPTGALLWSLTFKGAILSPAARGSNVYIADSQGGLAAITTSPSKGTVRWSLQLGKVSFGSPAIGPDGTVYTTVDDRLVAVQDTGSSAHIRWVFQPHGPIEVSPSVAPDGKIILGTNDGFEYGLNPSGAVDWRYPLGKGIYSYSTPAVTADGLAYFGDNNGNVHVVRASDGKVIGRYQARTQALSGNGIGVWTAPVIDGRHDVYFGTASGHILGYGFDGTQLFDDPTGAIVASYPALTVDGTLVVGSDNGTLYAFKS